MRRVYSIAFGLLGGKMNSRKLPSRGSVDISIWNPISVIMFTGIRNPLMSALKLSVRRKKS